MGGLMSVSLKARQEMSLGLSMSPRLQQAIQCLGMSNFELAEYLEEIVQSNPFVTRSRDGVGQYNADLSCQPDWSDVADPRDLRPSLYQYLSFQLDQAALPAKAKSLGRYLIGCVDEDGYLRENVQDLSRRLKKAMPMIEDVLACLQEFDPPGVMSRNLAECLARQLERNNQLSEGLQVLLQHLEDLPDMQPVEFARLCPDSDADLDTCRAMLATLDPHPGRQFSERLRLLDPPDVLLAIAPDGGWSLRLNETTLPRPLMDRDYVTHIRRDAASPEVKQYVRMQCDEANWLIRAFDQRAQTILAVCQEIVRRQDASLADENRPLVPLTMANVAVELGIHESTVSRAVRNKTMETPRGIIELKSLFCAAVRGLGGEPERSVPSVCHLIKAEIANEARHVVLTDRVIRDRLRNRGVDICRRTVSKYRHRMGIPAARDRDQSVSSKRAHCSRLR